MRKPKRRRGLAAPATGTKAAAGNMRDRGSGRRRRPRAGPSTDRSREAADGRPDRAALAARRTTAALDRAAAQGRLTTGGVAARRRRPLRRLELTSRPACQRAAEPPASGAAVGVRAMYGRADAVAAASAFVGGGGSRRRECAKRRRRERRRRVGVASGGGTPPRSRRVSGGDLVFVRSEAEFCNTV